MEPRQDTKDTQDTLNAPMRVIAAAVFVVMLGLATFMVIQGIWVGLVGLLILTASMFFIRTRMTVDVQRPAVDDDPLMATHKSALITAPAAPLSVWDGIELGTTAKGRLVVPLTDGSMIVAGRTRSGKTVFINNLIAACAMDPNVQISLFDGKGTMEFYRYRNVAKVDRSADPSKMVAFLTQLERECERRYELLGTFGAVKLSRDIYARGDMKLHVVFIDELANFTVTPRDKKLGQINVDLLAQIAAKGAGAGILLVLTNQRISADLVAAKIRSNIDNRIAFRVWDRVENDLALGPGAAKKGNDASEIPAGVNHRGIGFAEIAGVSTVKFRGDLLEYEDTLVIAEKAAAVRGVVDPASTLNSPEVDHAAGFVGEDDDDDVDVLEEDFLGPDRDLLADIKTAWRHDETRLHLSTILDRLKELDSSYYGTWSQQLFGRRIRDIGLAQFKKQMTIDNRVNNWGLESSALYAGPDGKNSKMERAERETAALDSLDEHEMTLHLAKVAEIRQATACSYCHRMFEPGETVTVDHMIPLNAGGTSHAFNLVPACSACNSSKSDRNVAEWLSARA